MSTFKDRLLTEKQELDEKLSKLNSFIAGPNFATVTGALDAIWKLHTEQKLNKHGVSGKRPTEGEIRAQAYSTMPLPEESCLINTVHENAFVNGARWIISKMSEAACASGAVDTVAAGGFYCFPKPPKSVKCYEQCSRCKNISEAARKSSDGQP